MRTMHQQKEGTELLPTLLENTTSSSLRQIESTPCTPHPPDNNVVVCRAAQRSSYQAKGARSRTRRTPKSS